MIIKLDYSREMALNARKIILSANMKQDKNKLNLSIKAMINIDF